MTAALEAVRDKPVALFQMDDSSPFQDYSGYGKTGTMVSGSPTTSISLAAGAVYSTVFNRTAIGKFDAPVFNQGQEDKPFSLESWAYPIRKTSSETLQTQFTNLATNPSFETAGSVQGIYTNQVKNPRLAVDSANWSISAGTGGTATPTRYATGGYNNYAYYEGVWTTVPTGGSAQIGMLSSFTVAVGEVHTFSAWVRVNRTQNVQMKLDWYDTNSVFLSATTVSTSVTANTWTRLVVTGTVPTNGAKSSCYVAFPTPTAIQVNDALGVTAAMMHRNPAAIDYFDGATKLGYWNDADFTAAWSGTANNSSSNINVTRAATVTGSYGVQSGLYAGFGSKGLRVLGGSTATTSDSFASLSLLSMGLQEGKTYTAVATMRQSAALSGTVFGSQQGRNLFIDITGGGGGIRYFAHSTQQTNAAGSYTHKITFTVPQVPGDPVTGLNLRLYNGYALGQDVWWDMLAVVEGNYTGPFFDGSMPGYEWTGTANASTSRTRSDVARVNLALNPDGKTGGSGAEFLSRWAWTGSFATGTGPTPHITTYRRDTVTTEQVNVGSRGIDLYTNNDIAPGTSGNAIAQPVIPGTTYTFSAWVRWSVVLQPTISIRWHDGAGNWVGTPSNVTAASTAANTWVRLSTTGTAPAGAKYMAAYLRHAGNVTFPANSTFDATGLLITRSGTLENHFSGNRAGGAWFGSANLSASYMLPSTNEQQVLSHSGQYDGLAINGTKISFSTKYLTTGECRASYDIQIPRRVHAVGVHTSEKNMLFIDGTLVAETEVTEAQKADQFIATDNYLYSGNSLSSMHLAVNNVGIYANALSSDAIARHYAVGNKHLSREVVPIIFGGGRTPLTQNEADVFLEQTWITEFDWESAFLTDVVVENDRLKPRLEAGVSVAGTWLDVFPLDAAGVTSIYGVNMVWDGEGAIIEASLNGTTWETVERGKNLAIIAPGYNPTNKDLEIRISFPGGVSDDPAYVDSLTITGFKTGVTPTLAGRTVTYTSPVYVKNDHEPVELSDDWGVRLNEGYAIVSADTSAEPVTPRTIEVWVKRNNDDSLYPMDARHSDNTGPLLTAQVDGVLENITRIDAVYLNGALTATGPLRVGEWYVMHIVATNPISGRVNLNVAEWGMNTLTTGDVQIGQVVLYEEAKTASQVKDIYDSYIGLPVSKATDGATIGITEPATAAVIYAHDWAISASG